MNNEQDNIKAKNLEQQPPERNASVDSAAFFEGDDYDDYDDFEAGGKSGGGGGANNNSKQKMEKRQQERGGGGGSGTIYSAKHIRAKEAQASTSKSTSHKK